MKKVELDLTEVNGNAFAIMGAFRRAAQQQGWEEDDIEAVLAEARSSDYDHLLQTIIKHTE